MVQMDSASPLGSSEVGGSPSALSQVGAPPPWPVLGCAHKAEEIVGEDTLQMSLPGEA